MTGNSRLSIFITLLLNLISFSVIVGGLTKKKEKIAVSCIGDSITFGARLDDPKYDSYPAQLQMMLGDEYHVVNLGIGSCALIRKGKPTVWNELSKIKEVHADMVVISLGTNDTCGMGVCGDRKFWEYKDDYLADYKDLIDTLRTFPSKPRIWICAPSPMVLETPGLSSSRLEGLTLRKPRLLELINLVKKVAKEKKVGFIGLNTTLDHKPELLTKRDGVHPNKAGYRVIAELVYQQIKN